MKLHRSTLIAFLCLSAFLFQTDKFMAFAATVPPGACLYALDTTADRAFQIAGAQSVYTACGVVSESIASDGFEMEGAETLYLQNHAQISVVGGADLTGQTYLYDTISGKDVSAVKVTSPGDPLASIAAPTTGTIVSKTPAYFDMNSKPANNTLSPGVYCGGLKIGNTNGTAFTLSPGVYIMAGGGLVLNSQAVVKGTGVTIYNTSSAGWGCSSSYSYTPITISGQVTATLSAPTSGAFDGILFFGNRTGCATKGSCVDQINGGSTAILNGALYFASDEIEISGSNASGYMMLVADKIYINGNTTIGNNGNPFDGITVSVSPTTVTLFSGQTQQFTATVSNAANSAVTWTISPAGMGSISSTGLYTTPSIITSAQTVTVTATSQADNTKLGTAIVTLAVAKTTPTITWATPAAITYGTALSATQLNATASVSGTFVYSPALGTVLTAGTQTLSATFTPSNTTLYNSATASVTLTVNKATPVITWAAPAAITYGTALSATQLNASLSVAGSCVYSPAAGTVLTVGMQSLSVNCTPTDSTDYAAPAAKTVQLTVNQATPTVSVWPTASAITYGQTLASSTLTGGTASVAGSFAFSAPTTAPNAGTASESVIFTPTASTNYSTVTGTVSVTVNQATSTVSVWPTASAITYGQTLASSTLTGGTASVAGSFAFSAPTTAPNAGTASESVIFTPTASTNYSTVTGTVSVTVNQATPTVSVWPTASAITYGQTLASSTLTGGTASVAGSFAFSAPTTAPNAGTASESVIFTPTASTNYSTVTGTVSVTVNQATSTVSVWPTASAITYGQTLASSTLTGGTASVAGSFAFSAPTTAPNAGTASESVIFTPTASTNYSTVTGTVSVTVNQATSTVSVWPTASAITYGQTLASSTLTGGTASVAGSFAFSAPTTAPNAGTASESVIFTPTASTNYSTVTGTVSVTVNQATPTVSVWPTASAITYGQTLASSTLTGGTASVAGSFAFSAPTTAPNAGTASESVIFTPIDTNDYNAVVGSVSVSVGQATPVITWATPTAISSGTTLSATQLDASASVPGSFVYSPASGTIPAAGNQTLSVVFTPNDTADYATTTASVVLTVNPATSCAGNGYSIGRAITINHNLVPNTDQTNFPFLFNTTDPLLATTANGGHVSNPSGYDIIFTSDAAGQNPLPYELEEFNPQIGQVIAWVQVPTVSHSQDTTIYLFYGNSNITTSQQSPTSVWDANYLGVWHVANNGGQLSLTDSTRNGNNATNNGATSTAGQIDGGMATNGTTYATVGTLPNLENTLSGTATYSVWVNPSANTSYGGIFGEDWPGWSIGVYDGGVEVQLSAEGVGIGASITPDAWSYLTVTVTQSAQADGTQVSYGSLYINGVLNQSYPGNPVADVAQALGENPTVTTYLGLGPAASGSQSATASEDEFRISSIARSSDWIATEYANQSSPSTFYNLSPEGIALNTYSVSLYQGQTQQFTASVPGNCSGVVSWSISPVGAGTIDQTGLYTAPASIVSQQIVTVTATSGSSSVSATVTLIPPVAVSITPTTAAFTNGGQQQQFTATVVNTSNTTVTWSMSPPGAGTIDQTGLYTAPENITSQQTVTVTATSQFDPTKSATASITLTPPSLPPPICASNGYSFMRPIAINHNLVPNTDQANFPFLFNTTDPAFATTGNGGHMANINADDLIFTTDPAGQNTLNYEIEEYNPVTGQIIAWIQVPNLSHTTDTVLYMFYGNAAIASSQQNPSGVWDSNFMGVWHVANPNGQLSLSDSTSNGDSATSNGATPTAGQIDGGMSSLYSYATIGAPANLANLAHGNATFSAWVNPAVNPSGGLGNGIILGKGGFWYYAGWSLGVNNQGQLGFIAYDSNSASECCHSYPVTTNPISSGWNLVAATIAPDPATPSQDLVTLYVNGAPSGSGTITINTPEDDSWFDAFLANNYGSLFDYYSAGGAFNGSEDEFRISNIVRSPDWIATEYNNQSSPSTFYQLYSENQQGIIPSATTLYASQTAQFTDVSGCGTASANWSLPASSPGTLTTGGLYTAPSNIANQQAISITAASQANGSPLGTSVVNLLPPMSVFSVNPVAPTLYAANETIQFTATMSNAVNNSVTWSVSPAQSGSITKTGLYSAPGSMSFPIYSTQTVTITATSVQNPTQSATATLTLMPVIVNPDSGLIYGGFSQQFTANIPVVWSLGPGAIGTISQTGIYTVPLNGNTSGQTFYLVATAQVDPNDSGTAWVAVQPPIVQPVTPATVSLYGGQSEAFNVCLATSATSYGCQSNGQTVANWSISPAGVGSISTSGVYTAPATLSSAQTVVITATDFINPLITTSATVTLIPPVVSISPSSATIYSGQTDQYFATVTNSNNTAVTWSIAPAGAGSISASGLYTAPIGITTQQTVTITATSQAVPTISASATVTLSPAQCAGQAYSYVRSIAIDHTKVPNSDQANFPFLFSVTDPAFASVANGGHVVSSSGNDILFSSDSAGINRLDYELEEYNPTTGQILAWVRIPTLTHASDTVIYMFYGNSSITTSQQNPGGVWDTNYQSVYHLANAGLGVATDSTEYGNSVSTTGLTSAQGDFDTAAGFNGTTSYIQLPLVDFASYPTGGQYTSDFAASFGVWFKTSSEGVILGQIGSGFTPGESLHWDGWIPALYVDNSGSLRGSLFNLFDPQLYYQYEFGASYNYTSAPQLATQTAYNDNQWHYAAITYGNSTETLYVDGQTIGSDQNAVQEGYQSLYSYFVGTGVDQGWTNVSSAQNGWDYFNGSLEEVEVSNIARSGDWLQTEYFNQSSPTTFFALSPEVNGGVSLNPMAARLYAGQSQQFTVLDQAMCGSGSAVWSMPAGSPGVLSSEGLYTAPSSIATQQTVPLTATTLGNTSTSMTATITLLPPVTIAVTPSSVTLAPGQSQQFSAVVSNATNTAANWTIRPVGAGTITASGLYTAPANSTVQTVVITATSLADTTKSASAAITLSGVTVLPSVSISVAPSSATLYGDQTQQFTATLTNTYDTAVTWTMSPAGVGAISSTGLYTAPSSITTPQTVTVTATSQVNPTQSASATISLSPSPCQSNGYSYVRSIAIDHTMVPNTDQTNFPFLFNTTDPTLKSTATGGHVTSPSGNDIIFSTDPNGNTTLNYELEQYNPSTGQVIAWVQIPTLSHSTDTILYMFYGNPSITAPQQNPAGVWDSNYGGVWHLSGSGNLQFFPDSTVNANTATVIGAVSVTLGPIGNGVAMGGPPNYIDAGNNPSVLPTHTGTFSIWTYYNSFSQNSLTTLMGNGEIWNSVNGTILLSYENDLGLNVDGPGGGSLFGNPTSNQVLSTGQWFYVTGTWDGSTVSLYQNGVLVGSAAQSADASPAYDLTIGGALGYGEGYLDGSLDEARVSGIARSADWIAAEYSNQSAPSSFYALSTENGFFLSPSTVALNASQSQQFTATGLCNLGVSWSMPVGSPGTLAPNGVYTAPNVITAAQTVMVTATSQTATANTATATITLLPPVTISLTPGSVTLTGDQTQQFTANVADTNNTAVTWTITPDGTGAIDAYGVYTAPSTIGAQQAVTITATSQADSTKSAAAAITLAPSECVSNGYGYQRVIVIDHTKVSNTDQINFPFLFSTTDLDLATTDNGGHVTSLYGYDIFFSTDPNGQTKLDHELEEYNPLTGQIAAWIRIPTLSHATDTLVYVFYGNPNITSSQQNQTGVWNGNYQAVYHLANVSSDTVTDSTVLANAGTVTSVSAASGLIDGAGSFNGSTSFIQIPSADFPSYPTGVYEDLGLPPTGATTTPFTASVSMWFKTSSPGGLLSQVPGDSCTGGFGGTCLTWGSTEPGYYDPAGWPAWLYVDDNGLLVGGGVTTSAAYNDNQWHYAAVTYATDGTDILYVDGKLQGSSLQQFPVGFSPSYNFFLGTAYTLLTDDGNWDWLYFNGTIDEVNVANSVVSSDWIQTQYNNQGSPATFYQYTTVSNAQVVPSTASLYASQTQQFVVPGVCNASIAWSIPSGAIGYLSASGNYTAPSAINSQQTVTITATNQTTGSAIGTAAITLLAQPQAITLSVSGQQPYQTGTSQSMSATVLDQQGNPLIGVTVVFTISGANSSIGSSATNSNGIATYSYNGTNNGADTIQATASIDGQVMTSNSLSIFWVTPTAPTTVAGVTLLPPPTLGAIGLMGAFTDGTGAVIQPIAIGATPGEFEVPAGATQLQLGVNSEYYPNDGGPGFNVAVAVNGVSLPLPVPVPPTAMPWVWVARGLNTTYQYGIYNPSIQNGILDGTAPIIAATNLSSGEIVNIAYQSGTASANLSARPLVNANGDQTLITGVAAYQGTYFPTRYVTPASYPVGQPISFNALVTNGTGAPVSGVPVVLTVAGANPQQLQATTDSAGTAAFLYSGANAGTDTLSAQAILGGGETYTSGNSQVTWINAPDSAPGSVALSFFVLVNDSQTYVAQVTDASGNPVKNANLAEYVWGVDNFITTATSDEGGHSDIGYLHTDSGAYNLVVVQAFNGNVIFSNVITGTWPPPSTSTCDNCNQITASISAPSSVTLPNSLTLTGTINDSVGITPSAQWSQISGPGTVSFSAPQQAITTASFSEPGIYVVQLYASDTGASATVQFQVTVDPAPVTGVSQGWIGSPLYGSTVSGLVPITLAPGVSLASGTLTLSPACSLTYYTNNCNNATVLNADTTGSGQIGTLDTTTMINGSYWLQLQATNSSGDQQNSLVLVTVSGNYKPGRVTATVTDLVVPATGLAINIQRTYDSLNASTSGDFGYGWNLGINVNLTVDPKGDVTFTLGGQRRTFDLTPQQQGCNSLTGCPFSWYWVVFTPEPGLHGTLTDSAPGCADGFDFLMADGFCQDGSQFNPPGYIYTDPNGTAYTISAAGNLQSIIDRSGNGLTITASGITSTTGLYVPFVRDAQNRITQITDPQGNIYSYGYDANGNLASVQYPNITQPSIYNYDANHHYTSGTDARGNTLAITTYYGPTDTDPNGLPLNGRVLSGTDALGQTTTYTYDLLKNSMTVTLPPDASGNVGTEISVDDSYGMMLSYTNPLGYTSTYTYDANQNRVSETDPLGHTTTYTYDSNGNTTSTTYPATATSKNTTSYTTYNQYSEATSFTDELGNVRTYNYDANYNPLSVTDGLGVVASYIFNANGQPLAGAAGYDITARPGMASQYAYDGSGNLASSTDALGRTTSSVYNALGQKVSSTVPLPGSATGGLASTTTYQYDPFGNLLQTAAPLGDVISSQYDANNNRISSTDARGNVTTYVYDVLNRLIETDYTDGTKSTKTYDFRNNVINSTDQNGNITHNTYDLAGKLLSVTRGFGTSNASTTTSTYDADGRKQSDTDPLGHTTTYSYDTAGHLITVTNAAGSTQYAYDDGGNQISVTDPKGNTTHSQFDARKRLVKTIFPDGTFTTTTYDGSGNVISTTDQAGNVVQNSYDAANQLVSVAYLNSPNAPSNTTAFAYNSDGNQTAMTDENGHTTQNAFDVLSRLTSTTLPDGSLTESRQYDAAGNLVLLTHFNGKKTTFTYDSLNRLLTRVTPGEPTVSFTYTPTGKLLTSTAGDGTVNYNYDQLDRLTTKATPQGTLSYTYYATGNVESITSSNASGVSVTLAWDELNRLSSVIDNRLPSGANTAVYTYDPDSNLVSATYPNGFQMTFTYDQLSRLTALSNPASSYTYQLGPTGNRTSATESTGRTISWNYDGIYRLTNETISSDPAKNNGSVSYSLDPVGNRLSDNSSLPGINSGNWGYNVDDEASTETYDANGNVLSASGVVYTYDSENHMTSMIGNGKVVTMVYDAFGNRVSKTVNGVTTQYLVDDENPTGLPQVVEELVNGVVQRQYTYGLQLISENQLVSNTWTPSFYETDGAGNVRQMTNSAGQVTDSYEYDAFGNEVNSTGATPNNYLYRGEQWDPDLGAYYLRARYYNPLTGRFLSVDPEAGQGQRRYQYAAADPVNSLDPTGNEAAIEWALIQEWPSRLPWISVHFPDWCGIPGIGGHLPGCNAPGPGAPPPPPPPKPPCKPNDPNCCKKCFNTQAFAQYLDDHAALHEGDVTPYHPSPGQTYCGRIVGEALRAGGASIENHDGGDYGPYLLGANFEVVGSDPSPAFHAQHVGKVGDVSIFGKTPKLVDTIYGQAKGHIYGHAEGYTGTSPSRWTSYWQQSYWTPYGVPKPGHPVAPTGAAEIYRTKCPCGQ